MIIKTVKGSYLKLFSCILAALSIAAVIWFTTPYAGAYEATMSQSVKYTGCNTNEGRIEFLRTFGWEVENEPISTETVTVPTEFDKVFALYNELQRLQGLDLSRYKQKNVTRYTYVIKNYPDYQGKVFAELLVYRGTVIGGDVCTESSDGFIHGFKKETHL